MIRHRHRLACFVFVVCSLFAVSREASADEYVWARSGWGNGSWGRNYSGMSNGYGGYYVPRTGYGNNVESRRPFTNPNGYIVPAGAGTTGVAPYTMNRFGRRRGF